MSISLRQTRRGSVLIRNLLVHLAEKILLMQPVTFGGLPGLLRRHHLYADEFSFILPGKFFLSGEITPSSAVRQSLVHMLRRRGRHRTVMDALAQALHPYQQDVLTAVELALADGVPTKSHVLTQLPRQFGGKVIDGLPLNSQQANPDCRLHWC